MCTRDPRHACEGIHETRAAGDVFLSCLMPLLAVFQFDRSCAPWKGPLQRPVRLPFGRLPSTSPLGTLGTSLGTGRTHSKRRYSSAECGDGFGGLPRLAESPFCSPRSIREECSALVSDVRWGREGSCNSKFRKRLFQSASAMSSVMSFMRKAGRLALGMSRRPFLSVSLHEAQADTRVSAPL